MSLALLQLLLALPVTTAAQGVPPAVDIRYESVLKDKDRNKSTPGNEFGDQHSYETGQLSFQVVDVSVPGNNDLQVEFRREINWSEPRGSYGYSLTRLADWEVSLPKIIAAYEARNGWSTLDQARPTKNCSVASKDLISSPPALFDPDYFPVQLFWQPPALSFPGESRTLLLYNDGQVPAPSDGGQYFWVTSRMDYASCLPQLKNAGGSTADEQRYGRSEGYLVRRADGTRYWFDWIAVSKTVPLRSGKPLYSSTPAQVVSVTTDQVNFEVYPTRIEDRFGNWVTYTYSNKSNEPVKLDRIDSSDGRSISIGYTSGIGSNGPLITSVTSNARQWTYGYSGATNLTMLSSVTNPDGSQWRYTGTSHPTNGTVLGYPYGQCVNPQQWMNQQNTDYTTTPITWSPAYTVENPSGAKAEFYVQQILVGKSNVTGGCFVSGYIMSGSSIIAVSDYQTTLGQLVQALVGKKVTGPGMPAMWWRYHTQSTIGFAPTIGSTSTKELGPEGTVTIRIFGNAAKLDEGLQLREEIWKSDALARSEDRIYLTSSSGSGFPKRVGYHPNLSTNNYADGYLRPLVSKASVVSNVTFSWQVAPRCGTGASYCVDVLGRPTLVDKFSSP